VGIRTILTLPNPLLRKVSLRAELPPSQWQSIIRDLWDTLDSHTGVGLAAPQIGESIRIIVVDATRAKRPVPHHGRMTLVNPVIIAKEGRISFREGCLSVPDYVAHIERAERILVEALNEHGDPCVFETQGFEAVIIQHEIDHLDGILFIDRIRHARDLKPRPTS